jgi:hypothetical protein
VEKPGINDEILVETLQETSHKFRGVVPFYEA